MKSSYFASIIIIAVIGVVILTGKQVLDRRYTSTNRNASVVEEPEEDMSTITDHQVIDLTIGDAKLSVEVVNTPESRQRGLSGRDQIGSDGMLFIFPDLTQTRFWMIEMQFGLDFVWIADNKVIGLTENVPPPAPGTPVAELPTYGPSSSFDTVLEVPEGSIRRLGIELGDSVKKCYHNRCYE